MATIVKGSSPKVRNRGRTPGYWVGLNNSRSNRAREIVSRYSHTGINYPLLTDVGSAAYRRLRRH